MTGVWPVFCRRLTGVWQVFDRSLAGALPAFDRRLTGVLLALTTSDDYCQAWAHTTRNTDIHSSLTPPQTHKIHRMPEDRAAREAWLAALSMGQYQGCGHMRLMVGVRKCVCGGGFMQAITRVLRLARSCCHAIERVTMVPCAWR